MKQKIGCSFDEQETVINISPIQISGLASVYTTIPSMMAKMWKLHEERPDEVTVVFDDKYGTEFLVPKDWIRIKPKKQISEEQRKDLAERLATYRKK